MLKIDEANASSATTNTLSLHLFLLKLHESLDWILLPLLQTDSIFGSSDGTLSYLLQFFFSELPPETQQALFTNVLSDDTVKRMNLLALNDVNVIILAF